MALAHRPSLGLDDFHRLAQLALFVGRSTAILAAKLARLVPLFRFVLQATHRELRAVSEKT